MPLTRYQIRDEYSLADPELYRAADKDDPEALLEGVAMAGLVGVLRQLGDLAEFAAQIFHDLHEEAMATATRGHGLTLRVQQLEAEFPSIEKAILSETSHTSFLHNAGFDWHPNLQMDQNLITRGDLPRFIMDSYEECRGPPRLFLLDKFDIAGAGACLKRYSDPSFFKAEFTTLKSTKSEDKREKRIRKTKKKVSRMRNGETPDVIQASHSRLHDLFLEERSQTEDKNVHKHRVRLKRRQSNSSLVDSTTRKSYMERILDSYSPNGEVVYGSSANSLHSKREHDNSGELVPEIHEISTGSPANYSVQKDNGQVPSPTRQRNVHETPLDELDREIIKEGILELPNSAHDTELEGTLSTICVAEDKKELVVDGERKIEANAEGYRSDDVTSEIDNYMDALNTMESEMETDTETRPRNEHGFIMENKWMDSNIIGEQKEIQVQFSDSHSMGSSLASEDGTNSFKKGRLSSSYSDSVINLPENVLSDGDAEAKVYPSTETFPAETIDMSAEKISEILAVSGTRSSKYAVSNGTCNEVPEMPSYESDFEEKTVNSYVPESTSALSHVPEACSSDIQFFERDSDEISSDCLKSSTEVSSSNAEENCENVSVELPCRVNASDLPSLARDDVRSVGSDGEQPVETLKGCNPDASYDATTYLADANDDSFEEFLPWNDAEDGSVENQVKEKLDLPDSVALPEDHCLAEQVSDACSVARSQLEHIPDSPTENDLDDKRPGGIVVETENAILSSKTPECLTSVLDCPETLNLQEKEFLEMTDEVPPLQLDLAEVVVANAEIESLDDKLASNVSDCVIKDGSALDKVHLNCSDDEKNNYASLDFSSNCAVSDSTKAKSAAEGLLELINLLTGDIHAAVDDKKMLINHSHRSIDFSSGDDKKLQEQGISGIEDLENDTVEVNEYSNLKSNMRINGQEEAEDQSAVVSSGDNLELSYQESDHLPSSPLIDDMHDQLLVEGPHKRSQLSDGSQVFSSSVDGNQDSEIEQSLSVGTEDRIFLSTHLLPEPEVPPQQGLEMPSDQYNTGLLQEAGESPKSSYNQSLQNEFPNLSDGFSSAPSKSFLVDPLSVPSDSNLLPLPSNYKPESFEPSASNLRSISHSFGLLNKATNHQPSNPQPNRPVFDLLPLDHNDQQAKVQETPPLPPLPPLQWRMGRFQQGSLPSEGMMSQHGFHPFSSPPSATADAIAQPGFPAFGGELLQCPNPFLSLPVPNDEKEQNISKMLQKEMMLPNLNPTSSVVPTFENEKIQCDPAIDLSTTQDQNPFLPQVKEKTQHICSETGEEMLQPTTTNVRIASLTSEGELEQPLNSVAPVPQGEDEKLRHTSQISGDVVQHPNSSASTTVENENSQRVSPASHVEFAWQSDIYADMPALDVGKLNGNLKARFARPRDPLIEAVASHDKINLRKVAERVRPEIKPRVDERDSLLEQIRTKSFNLKPATATRPSIQGPKTNLKVVAILEKANAIRQALAGSDEDDDEDSWSDS